MSQKWIRSKRWDDEHIPRALWPLRLLLRTFSSIPLAVVLLVLVALYGTLAAVPIGLIAAIPTYLLDGLSAVLLVVVVAGVPMWLLSRPLRPAAPVLRFPVLLLGTMALSVAGFLAWRQWLWPALRYDPATGRGFMMMAEFTRTYAGTTLRRLPGMEMSELEFYAWWPLRVILLMFVTNLVVATVRRIEFIFPNIGVLTVHTGIVTIALGSVYYAGAKQEGDMLLRSGPPDSSGRPTAGNSEDGFYDRSVPMLWVRMAGGRMEQRPIAGLPRYNDYGLNVLGTGEPGEERFLGDAGRTLRLPVPDWGAARPPGVQPVVGADVQFEVVGYASYTRLEPEWVPVSGDAATADGPVNPMRSIEVISSIPDSATGDAMPRSIGSFRFLPARPPMRWGSIGGAMTVEYARGMSAQRWSDLTTGIPPGVEHALVVEVPGAGGGGFKQVYGAQPGLRIEVGQTGYTLEIKDLLDHPPMPLITPGYEDAQSSVAIVHVTPPGGGGFDRWIYHRFPEISQDLLDEKNERGMPKRRDADPAIRISYIDASSLQVYFDEKVAGPDGDPVVRAIVRLPGRGLGAMAGGAPSSGGEPLVLDNLHTGGQVTVLPVLALKLGERWGRAVQVETPQAVPESEKRREAIGTHQQAAIAVRVSTSSPMGGSGAPWSKTIWVPFTQYLAVDPSTERSVRLPDGRELTLVFGRRRYTMPGLSLRLADFEMIPYPHSETPRDYRSDLIVRRTWRGTEESAAHSTSLNNPLLASPFIWADKGSWVRNALDQALLSFSPVRYKFSQSGWDQPSWTQTKAAAERGELPRPYVRFTILGVGNNPGIHVIAAGAVMMSVGIPWAFYVKPLIMRARKRRLQAELAVESDGTVAVNGQVRANRSEPVEMGEKR